MPIFLNFTCIFQLSSTYNVNSSLVWNSSPLYVMEVNGGTDIKLLITKSYTHSSPCHYMEWSSKLHVLATFSPVPTEKVAGKAQRESGHYGKEKIPLPIPGIKRFLSCPGRSPVHTHGTWHRPITCVFHHHHRHNSPFWAKAFLRSFCQPSLFLTVQPLLLWIS
jgi:hypothetical protein